MSQPGAYTRAEILSQPGVWSEAMQKMEAQAPAILEFFESGRFESVIFTGCGSTYYLALAAAATFRELTGGPAVGLPASEIWLYPSQAYPRRGKHLLVAVSRSGATTETIRAVRSFQQRGHGAVMTFSCYPDAPLAVLGDLNILLPEAQERSVAQTRAFSTLYMATVALAAICGRDDRRLAGLKRLPDAAVGFLAHHTALAEDFGRDLSLERFYFLGSGSRYGLACEVSLKMKEMSLTHSEPFHFMEFRHGPMSMVNEHTLLVGLVSETNCQAETAVLDEMRDRGAKVFSLAECNAVLEIASGLDEEIRSTLYLPVLQWMAFERSLAKGLNPDLPHGLTAVITLR
jgi:glucosamine--fructose-6-phosphate aminotransferase (isomerizing)